MDKRHEKKTQPENTRKSEIENHSDGDTGLCIANNIIIPTHIATTDNAIGSAPKRVVFEAIIQFSSSIRHQIRS